MREGGRKRLSGLALSVFIQSIVLLFIQTWKKDDIASILNQNKMFSDLYLKGLSF